MTARRPGPSRRAAAPGHDRTRQAGAVWQGRRGPVILGPTEHRVARYLSDMTRHGRVTIRTVDLATRLRLERSEAYRITRRLRVLGLFGIENDRSGQNGGRRYWRTAIEHDGAELDAEKHRVAWARVVAWARAQRDRFAARLAALREPTTSGRLVRARRPAPAAVPPSAAGASFADRMRGAGLGRLMDEWGV
jgi:predicted transcriptional regulator